MRLFSRKQYTIAIIGAFYLQMYGGSIHIDLLLYSLVDGVGLFVAVLYVVSLDGEEMSKYDGYLFFYYRLCMETNITKNVE